MSINIRCKLLPIKILSTAVALSPDCVKSSALDEKLNKPTGYVEKRSGVTQRFHASYTAKLAELGVAAINDALKGNGIAPESIDLLISASAIAIQALPFSAAQLLKISPLHDATASFDINTSCLSFVTALQVAACLLNTGTYKRIAIVSSEIPSRGLDWSDEESSLIFGDGAACVIVERGDGNSGICSFLLETYPTASRIGLTLMQKKMNIAQEKVIDIYRHRGN
ncbi:putative 3-oxoacyl-[acyl-carrier-protein (ACP)] synthase [Candidatus Regiella insecticola LSR1]|uniref:Putative 3-oxoacyl-[acyl-carrier-protein (ACP)] synthase n=1 Tax=Candidatus Regiella insecticola LSR1 TaxID=663321 RepID=E0WTR9_9ENTR|nr:putative 3-oxoacyl-[acyl-carrier-protein (ACP)] synthase [Candidatus Regiella insecticola LSR1]